VRRNNLKLWLLTDVGSDLADAFPNGELAGMLRADWIATLIKETRQNRDYAARTIDTAKWAREQVKKQTGMYEPGYRLAARRLTFSDRPDGDVSPKYIPFTD
jgi:hypothetical protein